MAGRRGVGFWVIWLLGRRTLGFEDAGRSRRYRRLNSSGM